MNYQVLARKWRPKSFAEIVGQEHVTRALKNALDNNRLHHAYLFTGTRGIGKTTLARIFAKCLNCIAKVTSSPCGQCPACREIDEGRFIDLIEIDAASRTKVEDTRELLDNVQYAPTYGRYKIYLIDEVHMLSGHSFNALLKTLEEPPAHVKFLLATTDPQKLPVTILSRCLQFNLKTIYPEKIVAHLASVLQQEQISFEPQALQQLARVSEGSIRDALSLLDQAIAYGNNKVTLADVNVMLGTIEDTHLFDLLTALTNHDANAAFTAINHLTEQAADFSAVLEELLSLLHNIALIQMLPSGNKDCSEALINISKLLSPEEIQLYYQIGLIGRRDLPFAPNAKSGFEMVILRMLAFKPSISSSAKTEATKKEEAKILCPDQKNHLSAVCHCDQGCEAIQQSQDDNRRGIDKPMDSEKSTNNNESGLPRFCRERTISITKPQTPKARNDVGGVLTYTEPEIAAVTPKNSAANIEAESWGNILTQLNLSPPTKAFAANCSLSSIKDNKVELLLHSKHAPILNKKHEERLNEAFSELLKKPMTVTISLTNMIENTPQTLAEQELSRKQKAAEEMIVNNENVQHILKTFNATIVPQSIKQKEVK